MERCLTVVGMGVSLAIAGCGGGCPDPSFTGPVQATWGDNAVVVKWKGSIDDPLPDRYYAAAALSSRSDDHTPAKSVTSTGPLELTFAFDELDARVGATPHLDIDLEFPDQQSVIACSHPGMADSFYVTLSLDFDEAAHTVSAAFGQISAQRGNCSASGAPSEPGMNAGWWSVVALASIFVGLRRGRRAP